MDVKAIGVSFGEIERKSRLYLRTAQTLNLVFLILIGLLIAHSLYEIARLPPCIGQDLCLGPGVIFGAYAMLLLPTLLIFLCLLFSLLIALFENHSALPSSIFLLLAAGLLFAFLGPQSFGQYPFNSPTLWLLEIFMANAIGFSGFLMLKSWAVNDEFNHGMELLALIFLLVLNLGNIALIGFGVFI